MMSGLEYRRAIVSLGLRPTAAARFLGINPTTSRRWIAGEHPIPICVEMLLKTMLTHDLKPDSVRALAKKR